MSLFLWVLIRQNSYSLTTLTGLPFSTQNWLHVHCIPFSSARFSEIQIDTRDSSLLLSSCSTPYRIPLPAARLTHHPHKNPFSIAILYLAFCKQKKRKRKSQIQLRKCCQLFEAPWCLHVPAGASNVQYISAQPQRANSKWVNVLYRPAGHNFAAFNGILPFQWRGAKQLRDPSYVKGKFCHYVVTPLHLRPADSLQCFLHCLRGV